MTDIGDQIRSYLSPPTDQWVAAYFRPDGRFAADTFDTLGANDPYQVTVDDLLAVTFLDVGLPPLGVRTLLGADAGRVTDLLWAVDPATDLWNASPETLEAAEMVWDYFHSIHGVGPVIAGKLLARKRPRLIPIVDSVVEGLIPLQKGNYWASFHDALADKGLREEIEALRPDTVDQRVSTLRLLDVALWMHGSGSGNAKEATGRA